MSSVSSHNCEDHMLTNEPSRLVCLASVASPLCAPGPPTDCPTPEREPSHPHNDIVLRHHIGLPNKQRSRAANESLAGGLGDTER